MSLTMTLTDISGVIIIQPRVFEDERGSFFESFNEREFSEVTGIADSFVQDNHSVSRRGVLRGLHYQLEQPQGKLVRVIKGSVFDVVVDLRQQSRTYKQWLGVELSAENKKQLWIPPGLAHGFLVLSEEAECLYKVTDFWSSSSEFSLLWSDSSVGIKWPDIGIPPILSLKDRAGLLWQHAPKF